MALLYNLCGFGSGRFQSTIWDGCCPDWQDTDNPPTDWGCTPVDPAEWQDSAVPPSNWASAAASPDAEWQDSSVPPAGYTKKVVKDTSWCKN